MPTIEMITDEPRVTVFDAPLQYAPAPTEGMTIYWLKGRVADETRFQMMRAETAGIPGDVAAPETTDQAADRVETVLDLEETQLRIIADRD
jgi:hypothetical protein